MSSYGILVPIQSSNVSDYETTNFAAKELQNFVYQSTGIFMPITINTYCESNVFSLGKTKRLSRVTISGYETLGEDGFIIKQIDNDIYIDGNTGIGVLYGVYAFLENQLGIRFFSADTTYIPRHSQFVENIDRIEFPAIKYRAYLNGDCYANTADYDFMARSRTSNPLTRMPLRYGEKHWLEGRKENRTHNMNYYIPPEYRISHPEFFYTRKGVTEVVGYADDGTSNSENVTVCLTNGLTDDGKLDESMEISALKVIIEELKKDIIKNPGVKYFTFEQEDLSYGCECEKCMEEEKKYGRSGMLIRFCNVLATELQKWANETQGGREINIVTFAYSYTKNAPVKEVDGKIFPIHPSVVPVDNLVIRLAIFGNAFYPLYSNKQKEETKKPLREWGAICRKFFLWGYDRGFDCPLMYWPSLKNIQQDVNDFVEKGFLYVQVENEGKNEWQASLKGYIYHKLLWNNKLDAKELENEFLDGYFGTVGANYVKKFINLYECFYEKVIDERNIEFVILRSYREPQNLDIDVIDESLELINEAINKTSNENINKENKDLFLRHLKQVRLAPLFCKYKGWEYYYPNKSKEEKKLFAKEFLNECYETETQGYTSTFDRYSYDKLVEDDYELPY